MFYSASSEATRKWLKSCIKLRPNYKIFKYIFTNYTSSRSMLIGIIILLIYFSRNLHVIYQHHPLVMDFAMMQTMLKSAYLTTVIAAIVHHLIGTNIVTIALNA